MKLKLHFFKGKLHTKLHTDCTRITHGLRAVYARFTHGIALGLHTKSRFFSNCAFRILRSLIDGTHSVVDRVGKIVFLLFHSVLVRKNTQIVLEKIGHLCYTIKNKITIFTHKSRFPFGLCSKVYFWSHLSNKRRT